MEVRQTMVSTYLKQRE